MESKPIFIIKVPRVPELWASVRGYVNNTPDLTEEYHVMLVAHSGDEVEFECFNSPYKPEELTQLTELIEKINKDYEQRD
jgi:hypothetical protein